MTIAYLESNTKYHPKRTPLKNWRNLVYYDVCGPMEVDSLGGNKYFVTFINDASRKTWVYLLHTKRQVFQYFHKFHAMVERETGNPLKRLQTDNGGEYISREFKEYCSKHGIMHEKTIPSISQHNSVAERMNRTIVEKFQCMLKLARLPKSFWGEAVNTVVYLINISPLVPLDFHIPQRVWIGKDIPYSQLKVCRCKAFMHVPKEQRVKLDDKETPCIFIGYGDEEFGYRLWDSKKKKIFRSRDIMFHEHETIEDMEKNVSGAKLTYEGIAYLTSEQTSLESATNEAKMSESKPRTELEEPVIEEEESGDDNDDTGGVDQGE